MTLLLLTLSFTLTLPVRAAEVTIVQAGQQFLNEKAEARADQINQTPALGRASAIKELKLKVGDVVTFKNVDKVTHNVYGEDFDLHAQPAGVTVRQGFAKPGHRTIKCAIHPKMKIELDVEP